MAALRRHVMISVLFVAFGGPGIVLLWLPWWITRFHIPADEPAWQKLLAAVLIAAGVAPLLESAARFVRVGRGTLVPTTATERLVVSGLYRHVRNPMYAGVTASLAAEAFLFRSVDLVVELVLVAAAFSLFVCLHEEPALARRYGEEYAEYRRNVPRWLPRLRPWRGGA